MEEGKSGEDLVKLRLDNWRRRLIDLSYRNRLIKFRATRATTLTVEAPSVHALLEDPTRTKPWRFFLPPEIEEEDSEESEAAEAVDDAVIAAHVALEVGDDEIVVSEQNPKRITRILDALAKRSSSELQDKGLRILYLAVGFLDWLDPKTEERISSPLALVPVELRRRSTREPYELFFVDDEETVINPSLTEKLRYDAGLDIPEDWTWEDKPLQEEFDEIREAVADTDWQVREEAVIGLFSFQKYVMFRDLLDNEEVILEHPVVRAFAGDTPAFDAAFDEIGLPKVEELDQVQAPDETYSVLDADATQRLCIEAAKRGQSFVMHGPPGTGKSQTIANIIAESVALGKRVLFVSEKAAALDVVHRRLKAAEIDDLCLMLHGEYASRRGVVEELYRTMTERQVPRLSMTEEEFSTLANLRTLLNDSVELLHLRQAELGDRTPRDVLTQLAGFHDAPRLPGVPAPSQLSGPEVREEFQQLREVFRSLEQRWAVSDAAFVWKGYAAASFSMEERGRTTDSLSAIAKALAKLRLRSGEVAEGIGCSRPNGRRAAEQLLMLLEHLKERPGRFHDVWLDDFGGSLRETLAAARPEIEGLEKAGALLANLYSGRDANSFTEHPADELGSSLGDLGRVAGRADSWDERLLAVIGPSVAFCDSGQGEIGRARELALRLARSLGQPDADFSIDRARDVVTLAQIAFTAGQRPEAEWMTSVGLDRARSALDDSADLLSEYQALRAVLDQQGYLPEAFELPAKDIAERFRTEYSGALSRLKAGYRRDAKEVKARRRDGKLPEDPGADLERIAEAQDLAARLDAMEGQLQQAFGSYFAGRETVADSIASAIETASKVRGLTSPDTDLSALAARVCGASDPDVDLALAADQLTAQLDKLSTGLQTLRELCGDEHGLTEQDALEDVRQRIAGLDPPLRRIQKSRDDLSRSARVVPTTLSQLEENARLVQEVQVASEQVEAFQTDWERVLVDNYRGPATSWGELTETVDWLVTLESLCSGELSSQARGLLPTEGPWPGTPPLANAIGSYDATAESLVALFGADSSGQVAETLRAHSFSDVEAWADALAAHIDDLGDYVEFRRWMDRAGALDWREFAEGLADKQVAQDEVVGAFVLAYWTRRLESLLDGDEGLGDDLRGEALERWVAEFSKLDRKLVSSGADRLLERRESARRDVVLVPGSEENLVRTEHGKKRRHRPVRKLLADLPTLLSDLKPCLMLSPLSVSHFLTAGHRFDLVVFDEASQVQPEDAINCIYRGDQLIVAGDSEQLPPTPFFRIAESEDTGFDDETAGTEEDMESILDSAKALLPEHRLRWHYRSRDERLIEFSNRHIYHGGLVTFPAADHNSTRKGIDFIHVPEGLYDRGGTSVNRVEAEAVANRVVHYLREGLAEAKQGKQPRSVGVIAFNTQQSAAISEELDRLMLENEELEGLLGGDRLENTFVKHLEAVQGDERDVIVFSVGFGYDAEGKFLMNFGPLNKAGGRRRLNVAVTRAREKVELVASVRPEDFRLGDNASEGSRLLRDYIAFASAGRDGVPADIDERFESDLERQIGQELERRGYAVEPQVGAGTMRIALGVKPSADAERFVLGVETDGENHRRIPTARDRERLRPAVLQDSLGWRLHRIWAVEWVRNRRAELEKLEAVLEEGLVSEVNVEDAAAPNKRKRELRDVVELTDGSAARALSWVVPYPVAPLTRQHSGYEFHESPSHAKLKNLLSELLEVEAPVSEDYAVRRLARAWGLGRVGHRVRSAGERVIRAVERDDGLERREHFLWLPEQALTAVRVPSDDEGTLRSIEDIPPEEISLAVSEIRRASRGTTDDVLVLQVARIFGFERTGERIKVAIEEQLNGSGP